MTIAFKKYQDCRKTTTTTHTATPHASDKQKRAVPKWCKDLSARGKEFMYSTAINTAFNSMCRVVPLPIGYSGVVEAGLLIFGSITEKFLTTESMPKPKNDKFKLIA